MSATSRIKNTFRTAGQSFTTHLSRLTAYNFWFPSVRGPVDEGNPMGIFGPPKYAKERTFSMPCSPAEALSVIAGSQGVEGGTPFGEVMQSYLDARERGEQTGQPPLAESIYLEKLDESGMVIAAGNRVKTMWRMQLSLTGSDPVSGSFGAIEFNQNRWFKNLWEFNHALGAAVRSVGGKRGRWPAEF